MIFGVVYTAIMFGFLVRILFLDGASSGRHLLLMTLMVTKFSDMGAYLTGSLIGVVWWSIRLVSFCAVARRVS